MSSRERRPRVRMQLVKTALIIFSYFVVGWSDSLFGPFYSQYQVSLNSTTADTSYLVQSSFAGFTLGNLILLVQNKWWSIHAAYVLCILCQALANLSIPHIRSLWLMCTAFFISGLAGGTIQAGSISRILILWGTESASLLQLLDFGYAIGSIIGPFISAPFIVEIPADNVTSISAKDLKIIYPHSIVGTFGTIAFAASLVIFFVNRQDDPHSSRFEQISTIRSDQAPALYQSTSLQGNSNPVKEGSSVKTDTCKADQGTENHSLFRKKCCVISLASLTYAFVNGIGMIEQNFLTKYVTIGPFHLSAVIGASMTGSSWIIHTICGFVFVFLIRKLGIATNLVFGASVMFATANLFLLSSLYFATEVYLWLVVVGFAVGGTTFFSCLVAFLDSTFPVSPRMTSLYLITNCICNIIWPALVGQFIEQSPIVFVLVIYACSTVSIVAVVSMIAIVKLWFKEGNR